MKRLSFIAALFAPFAFGQRNRAEGHIRPRDTTGDGDAVPGPHGTANAYYRESHIPGTSRHSGPQCAGGADQFKACHVRNGECPVCGTMAEPWKRETWPTRVEGCGPNRELACITQTQAVGPTERITRCRVCNCAFYQDPEN